MIAGLFKRLLQSAQCRYFWWALAGLMALLEIGALVFQYVWQYYPCEVCIYVRVWVMAILILALLAQLVCRCWWGRLACTLTGLGLALGLSNESWHLIKIEYGVGDGGSCGFVANFPSWAPLDKWLPSVFEVQGLCQATPEIIFGITMTHVLVVVSAALVAWFSVALVGVLMRQQ